MNVLKLFSALTLRLTIALILIHSLGTICLAGPLAKAAVDAKRPFLKDETFTLISKLVTVKPDPDASPPDSIIAHELTGQMVNLLVAVEKALADSEMVKPKRIRPVLKAAEKLVAAIDIPVPASTQEHLKKIFSQLQDLEKTGGGQLKSQCTKLMSEIERIESESQEVKRQEGSKQSNSLHQSANSSKKSSKKKKKKKNR